MASFACMFSVCAQAEPKGESVGCSRNAAGVETLKLTGELVGPPAPHSQNTPGRQT